MHAIKILYYSDVKILLGSGIICHFVKLQNNNVCTPSMYRRWVINFKIDIFNYCSTFYKCPFHDRTMYICFIWIDYYTHAHKLAYTACICRTCARFPFNLSLCSQMLLLVIVFKFILIFKNEKLRHTHNSTTSIRCF